MMKYKTLDQLMTAFHSGELSIDDHPLVLDNDSTRSYRDTGEEWEVIFDGGTPDQLLRQALTLIGVPWEDA